MEGLNGRATQVQNEFSWELSARLGARVAAGSDAHRPQQVGTAATNFHRDIHSLAGLIEELKAGRFEPMDLVGARREVSAQARG